MTNESKQTTMRDIVDALNKLPKCPRKKLFIKKKPLTLRPVRKARCGNSYLLYALAWNSINASVYLSMMTIMYDPKALKMKDRHTGSRSTPLILASKTGNNQVAMLLVGFHKSADYINATDYKKNTALHYACIMRNNDLIEALILRGANIKAKNKSGKMPIDYYNQKIGKHGLGYRYGATENYPGLMNHVPDWGKGYSGTINPVFSNYRWFLPHIVTNLGLVSSASDIDLDRESYLYAGHMRHRRDEARKYTLKEVIDQHLEEKIPVVDIQFYNAMAQCFKSYHQSERSMQVASQLEGGIATATASFSITCK